MKRVNTALDNVKFDGLLGDMLDVLSVRGHMISNFAHVMGFYGTSLDRYPHVEWRGKIYAGMNWVLVGHTSCGKGESLRLVTELFDFGHRYEYLLAPVGRGCPTSGKQLAGTIYDQLHQYDDDENRYLAIWEEYIGLLTALSNPNNKANTYLIDLCDGNEINESFKTGNIRLSGVHYGSIGHITPMVVRTYLKDKLIFGGLANRHTFMYVPDSEYRRSAGQYDQKAFAEMQGRLISSLENGIERSEVKMTPDAEERFLCYDEDKFKHPSSNEKVGALMARFTNMCLKVAMIISIINGEEEISLASMESSCAVMEYSKATLDYLFGDPVASPTQLILDFIKTNSPVTRTDITREFKHMYTNAEMDKYLLELLSQNQINETQRKRSRGRIATIYSPVE